jgi:hypothetical protein
VLIREPRLGLFGPLVPTYVVFVCVCASVAVSRSLICLLYALYGSSLAAAAKATTQHTYAQSTQRVSVEHACMHALQALSKRILKLQSVY